MSQPTGTTVALDNSFTDHPTDGLFAYLDTEVPTPQIAGPQQIRVNVPQTVPIPNQKDTNVSQSPQDAHTAVLPTAVGDSTTPTDKAPVRGSERPIPTNLGTNSPAPTGSDYLAPLRDKIASGEAPLGYNERFGGGTGQDLTKMTVSQVADLPPVSVTKEDGSVLRSTASGRYQFLSTTLKGLISGGVVDPNATFDSQTQDQLANHLIQQQGLSAYQSGKISSSEFLDNLSKEWASLPTAGGNSYYKGQASSHAPEDIYSALPSQTPTAPVSSMAPTRSIFTVASNSTPQDFQEYLKQVEADQARGPSGIPTSEEGLLEISRMQREALKRVNGKLGQ